MYSAAQARKSFLINEARRAEERSEEIAVAIQEIEKEIIDKSSCERTLQWFIHRSYHEAVSKVLMDAGYSVETSLSRNEEEDYIVIEW